MDGIFEQVSNLYATSIWCFKDKIGIIWNHPSFNAIGCILPFHNSLIDCEDIVSTMVLERSSLPCRHYLHASITSNLISYAPTTFF